MTATRPGDDSTPRAGEGGPYRKTPTQLATDPAFTTTYASVVGLAGTGIDTTGTADSTAVLNTLLAASAGKVVRGIPGASYKTSAPLVVYSGTTLDMTGCTVTLAAGSNCNIVQNRAFSVARTVGDVSTTASSTTITSATAAFVSADVGKAVRIYDAGTGSAWLDTTIASVTNGTTAVLAVAPSATLTNAGATIGARDTDITITGGTWVRAAGNGTTPSLAVHSLLFRRVDRLRIERLRIQTSDGKYAISIADAADFLIDRPSLSVFSDGVHLNGLCYRGVIRGVSGTVGDDMIATTPNDAAGGFTATGDVNGNIAGLLIEDCRMTGIQNGSTPNAVALYGDPVSTFTTSNVTARRCGDHATANLKSVRITDAVKNITVDDCTGAVFIAATTATTTQYGIRIRGQRFTYAGSTTQPVYVSNVTIDDLLVEDITLGAALTTALDIVVINPATTINTLTLRNCHHLGNNGRLLYIYGAGTAVKHAIVEGCHREGVDYTNGRGIETGTSSTVSRLVIANCRFEHCSRAFGVDQSAAVPVHVVNSRLEGTVNVRASQTAMSLFGMNNSWGGALATASAGSISSKSFDFIADLSTLAANVSDLATNTSNANTGTLGVGPAVCISTTAPKWKSLVSGNTW